MFVEAILLRAAMLSRGERPLTRAKIEAMLHEHDLCLQRHGKM